MKTTSMLSMNDKMLKVILLVAIFATQVPLVSVSAQNAPASENKVTFVYEGTGVPMEIGDTVWIDKDSLRYLTGERMSTWVYDVPHQIRQLGTKTKPTGVLLRGIYSWIAQGSLLAGGNEKLAAIEAEKAAEAAAIAAAEAEARAQEEAKKAAEAAALAAEAAAKAELEAAQYAEYLAEQDSIAKADSLAKVMKPFQVDRLSVGVRGGFASSLAKPTDKMPLGFDVLLDVQYAHYWVAGQDKPRFGIMTGLSLGYMQDTHKLTGYTNTFNKESEGTINYSVKAGEVKAINRQLQLEIPVMFSMILDCGFYVNAGPKLILPLYTPYKQTISNPSVSAHLNDVNVDIAPNNPVMGAVSAAQCEQKGMNNNQFKVTLALGAELGYEFYIFEGQTLGVGAYVNGGVFNAYKPDFEGRRIIEIDAPTAEQVGKVTVNSLTNGLISKLNYFDAGIKVTYNFDWLK